MTDVLGYSYSLTVFIGGLIGYIKAGSTMSLLAGTIFGSLSALGARQVSSDSKNVMLAFMVSFFLFFIMGLRFYRGRKWMPAGLVTLLSFIMLARYGARLF
ncbi:transmembrane protein 14C-like protein [Cokeromyces recurvatus]|uniref:transmembrane protein 14C-like protein n=1 Tax=Cokeromyces recurvatus TaxID=90255 RepID=UPI00221FD295|nr:transmembrane protein 14C-like protein [Cokeromyces recurvatus]KAI7901626.1 transmembrane protein 14C-like protein [Cokeromyces recurvatus]